MITNFNIDWQMRIAVRLSIKSDFLICIFRYALYALMSTTSLPWQEKLCIWKDSSTTYKQYKRKSFLKYSFGGRYLTRQALKSRRLALTSARQNLNLKPRILKLLSMALVHLIRRSASVPSKRSDFPALTESWKRLTFCRSCSNAKWPANDNREI